MGEKAPSPPRPPPLPSPSARGKFLHNTYNISTAAHRSSQVSSSATTSPNASSEVVTSAPTVVATLRCGFPVHRPFEWTSDEHARFVAALEQFGAARATSAHTAWHAIAAAVRSRSVAEVKAHATQYLALLQGAQPGRGDDRDEQWTASQDAAFEQLLAVYSNVATGYPWTEMATQMPGKTPQELQQRYFELCDDISRIERDGSFSIVEVRSGARGKPPRKRSTSGGKSDGSKTKEARRQSVEVLPALTSPLIASGISFSFLPLPSPFTPRFTYFSATDGGDTTSEMTRMPSPTSRTATATDISAPLLLSMPTLTYRQPSPMFFPPPPSPFGLTPNAAAGSSRPTPTPSSSSPQSPPASSAFQDSTTSYYS